MKRVIVHIDRLVLNGIRHADRHALAAGLQQELQRGFGDRQAVSRLSAAGDTPGFRVGGVHIARSSTPQRIGESVARGIGREIKR
jgi:hypothetical protein